MTTPSDDTIRIDHDETAAADSNATAVERTGTPDTEVRIDHDETAAAADVTPADPEAAAREIPATDTTDTDETTAAAEDLAVPLGHTADNAVYDDSDETVIIEEHLVVITEAMTEAGELVLIEEHVVLVTEISEDAADERPAAATFGGLDYAMAERLAQVGIQSGDDLLQRGAVYSDRETLMAETGMDEHTLMDYISRADLARVPGMTNEYAERLLAGGITSVPELAYFGADDLAARIAQGGVEPPDVATLALLTAQARALPQRITYRPTDAY